MQRPNRLGAGFPARVRGRAIRAGKQPPQVVITFNNQRSSAGLRNVFPKELCHQINSRDASSSKVSGAAALAHSIPAAAQDRSKKTNGLLLYVGTYTNGKSEGIYVYRMNPDGGGIETRRDGQRGLEPVFSRR